MTRRPAPTLDQLLNLADRAEDGPLTAAEATRLRQGLRHLATSGHRRPYRSQRRDQPTRQLAALARIVHQARTRGARTVPVWALTQVLTDPSQSKEHAA
ncbi:hypothetical protein ACGF5F_32515 [Streptomyces sp. NPDC047821]|uniref:hypothetical protein n=1 Tax=Streptomyces sp. NPDC047821 TaxID=3365488 RepID=UPI00371CD379